MLKKCSFLRRKSLLDLYFKVILPSVSYGITIWGNWNNLDHIKSLQALHCRAGRLIYNLPWDTPSKTVMEATNWDSTYDMYKINLVKLFYNIVNHNMPPLIVERESIQPKRTQESYSSMIFNTFHEKRGPILWNFFPIT